MKFAEALNFHKESLISNTAVRVLVQVRTPNGYTDFGEVDAVLGKTKVEDFDGVQKRVDVYVFDFIIAGEHGYIPRVGDRFIYNGGRYVVRPINNECWRWDNPYEVLMRIHTQKEATINP